MKISLREKLLNDGRKSLYFDIYHAGKRRYEFLNLYLTKNRDENKATKKLAEQIQSKRLLELSNNEFGFQSESKRKTDFIKYFEAIEKTKPKHSIYYSTLVHFKAFSKGKVLFYEIDEKYLEKFKNYLLNLDSISQNSAREYFSVTKRILRKAVRDKIITQNPADFVDHIKGIDIDRTHLEIEEVRQLAKTDFESNFDIKRGFLFCCFTGLRYSDLKALTWENVKSDYIQVRQKKTKDMINIPLSFTAKEILYMNKENVFHFPQQNVFNVPYRWYGNDQLKKFFKKAGINKNAHWHISRHTFAVLNINEGVEIYTVSKLLGHKNLRTTEIYSKVIDKKKREAIDRLPIVEMK
jgi:integrase